MNKVLAELNFGDLEKALVKAKKFATIKEPDQITSQAVFLAGKDSYELFAFDWEVGILAKNLKGSFVGGNENFLLDVKALSDLLGKAKKLGYTDKVVVYDRADDENNRTVECYKKDKAVKSQILSMTTEMGMDAYYQYNTFKDVLYDNPSDMPLLIKHITHALKRIDYHAYKIEFRGVLLEQNEGEDTLKVVTTDTRRLYVGEIKSKNPLTRNNVIVCGRGVKMALAEKLNYGCLGVVYDRVLNEAEGCYEKSEKTRYVVFASSDYNVYAATYIGEYASYRRIMISNPYKIAEFDKQQLRDATILLTQTVKIIGEQNIACGTEEEEGTSIDVDSPLFKGVFGINSKYLADILDSLDEFGGGDSVVVNIQNGDGVDGYLESQQKQLRCGCGFGGNGYQEIIMPIVF